MSNRRADAQGRAAAIRAQHQSKERRRTLLIVAVVSTIVLALVGLTATVLVGETRRQDALLAEQERLEESADAPIPGVQEYGEQTRAHVPGPVGYEINPPVGGDHLGTDWATCQVYSEPVPNELGVHSLEHGAVWVTYRADLSEDQVEELADLVELNDYALLSPVEEMESPVAVSAWGLQLRAEDSSDPRIAQFIVKYAQGEQTPEPGAAC